jgi:uncharacterized metal-binding protein
VVSLREEKIMSVCATCNIDRSGRACSVEGGAGPEGCPTLNLAAALSAAREEYDKKEINFLAVQASAQEAACYANRGREPGYVLQPTKPRIQEIWEFAHRIGCKKAGLAFCVGLRKEAGIVAPILEEHGLEVVSVVCKVGRVPKAGIGVPEEDRIIIGSQESMCNPIGQAAVMNHEKTQLNIILGLCVGHDSLFIRYSEAPVTVLAVKDRVTGHNPLAAVYTSGSYYRKLHKSGK